MPAMIMESFSLWQLNHFLRRFDEIIVLRVCIRRLVGLPYVRVRSQSHGIIRLVLYVIMYFIFYFSIGYGTAFAAYHMFAIDVICEFCHIHLVQAFVLNPPKAGIGKRRSI